MTTSVDAIEEAERAGFDLSLIDQSLARDLEPGAGLNNLCLGTDLGALDILGSILGVGDFERVRSASIEIEMFDRACRVISLDDLIRAKEALGREKDLLAVKELRAIRAKMQP